MLDLQPRIRLDEVKAAAIEIDEKLHCPDAAIIYSPADSDGGIEQSLPQRGIQTGCRSNFDDFLPLALQAAFAVPQMDDLARAVADDLNLDMTRPADELFAIDGVRSKSGERFRTAALIRVRDGIAIGDRPHSTASTAGHCLDHHCAVTIEKGEGLFDIDGSFASRRNGNIGRLRNRACHGLVAERLERRCCRSDED